MALPHAILVSLCEQAGSGYELAHRFDRSIGFFWAATHQQIYRTLRAMEGDGWVHVAHVAQQVWLDGRAMPMRSRQTDLRDRYLHSESGLPRAYPDSAR